MTLMNRTEFTVNEDLTIHDTKVLAGTYPGYIKVKSIKVSGRVTQAKPSYHLELSREELEEAGNKVPRGYEGETFDITDLYQAGIITID